MLRHAVSVLYRRTYLSYGCALINLVLTAPVDYVRFYRDSLLLPTHSRTVRMSLGMLAHDAVCSVSQCVSCTT